MLASIIRTCVPVIAGVLLGWAAKVGLDLPSGAVTEIVTVVLTTVYYAAARYIEQIWPRLGNGLLSAGLARKTPGVRRQRARSLRPGLQRARSDARPATLPRRSHHGSGGAFVVGGKA